MIHLLVLGFLLVVAGCAAQGPPGSAIEQRFVWFSYLAGEDIRAACDAGASDRFRFIFNADFNREVRALDVAAGEGGASLSSRRYVGSGFVRIDAPHLVNEPDAEVAWLGAAAFDELRAVLVAEVQAPTRSKILESFQHYAVVTACSDGDFVVRGFDARDLRSLRLFRAVQSLDPIGSAWPAPDPTKRRPLQADARDWRDPYFVVRFDAGGRAMVTGS